MAEYGATVNALCAICGECMKTATFRAWSLIHNRPETATAISWPVDGCLGNLAERCEAQCMEMDKGGVSEGVNHG